MERFIEAYSDFLDREYGSYPSGEGHIYSLLYTGIDGTEIYGDDNDDMVGELLINVDTEHCAYIVEFKTYDGETYEVTEVHNSIDEITFDLNTSGFDEFLAWGITQIQTVLPIES